MKWIQLSPPPSKTQHSCSARVWRVRSFLFPHQFERRRSCDATPLATAPDQRRGHFVMKAPTDAPATAPRPLGFESIAQKPKPKKTNDIKYRQLHRGRDRKDDRRSSMEINDWKTPKKVVPQLWNPTWNNLGSNIMSTLAESTTTKSIRSGATKLLIPTNSPYFISLKQSISFDSTAKQSNFSFDSISDETR